ncbi:MAG: GTPase Era [Candidatus Poribacteria bacterium]|nr:GTPase Era [Candidatus Poribacteria bacterium]
MTEPQFKSGYVSIIGEPNVGKSTLLNAMLGEKLAIVTPKPQTTRNQIRGIVTSDDYQIIFLDTPGILRPKYQLHNWMVKAAYAAIQDADLILYLIDVTRTSPQIEEEILNAIHQVNQKTILVINKIDRIAKLNLLPIIDNYSRKFSFVESVPISALNQDGIERLKDLILGYLPSGPQYFPPDQISDLPQRFFIAETIREQIFLQTKQEVPYSTSVVVEEFVERNKKKWYIRAVVYVERPSQRGVLIGKQGQMIKRIGQLARTDIERFLAQSVFLELHVLVKPDWRNDLRKMQDLGYV